MELFHNIAKTKDIIWDLNGTLKTADKKDFRADSYQSLKYFSTLQTHIVTGSNPSDIKCTIAQNKILWFSEQSFAALPLYIGDGPNDAAVWREYPLKIISGCVSSNWGHSVSKWSCFTLKNKEHPLHGLPILHKVSKWAKNTQMFCQSLAFVYTVTVFALTMMGYIANPMLACALLCASSLLMCLIVMTSTIFAPEILPFKQDNKSAANFINTQKEIKNEDLPNTTASPQFTI